jgi:5-methyltetrahydrofolate--homocysteine methyltransferase
LTPQPSLLILASDERIFMSETPENLEKIKESFTQTMLELFEPEKHWTERNLKKIGDLVAAYSDAGIPAKTILRNGLLKAMEVVAEKFKRCELFLPEMILASQAVQLGMDILGPELQQSPPGVKGKILIGTVEGDVHDIGKNLVIMMLEGRGFEVKDLGVCVPVEKFLWAAQEFKPHIVALSAMLTTTRGYMRKVIKALSGEIYEHNRRIIVGGGSVDQAFAKSIWADAYAEDCIEAVEKCSKIREQQVEARMGDILEGMFLYGG